MNNEYLKYVGENITTENGNNFKITKYISQGGNGFVFECVNNKNKTFVLKLLHTTEKVKIANFKKEIQLQKEINSEYIVKCVDSGEKCFCKQTKPRPFYIMEKYDTTLENLINENRLTPLNAYRYSIQLCRALKVLHKHIKPIIHRDLKPENILFDEKNNKVLLCDFGLAHIETDKKTINKGFVGNIDYHAPEQKVRGKNEIGTYTDIYSLGLIINVLFTKEIAQGENYKKIWQTSPYFSFVDTIVDRMIRHDIKEWESDINSIILDLEKHELECELEESVFKAMFKDKGLTEEKIKNLMDLFSLFNYTLKNKMDWSKININYFCDFHFSCDEMLKNTILIKCYYEHIKKKFEYEGVIYKGNEIPYNAINLSLDENKKLYESFVKKIDSVNVLEMVEDLKNIIKKYFISLCDYHAEEIFQEFKEIENSVNHYCIDAPILCISYFISTNIPEFVNWGYEATKYINFDKYELSNVNDKMEFTIDADITLKELDEMIKKKIEKSICTIRNGKLEVLFETILEEQKFEKNIKDIVDLFIESDVRKEDILDIIRTRNFIGLKKIYLIDKVDAKLIIEGFKQLDNCLY